MSKTRIGSVSFAFLALAMGAFASGPRQHAAARTVSGTWNMTVKGPVAHGDLAATLSLTQSDASVKGTFRAHGNEHPVAGEFTKDTLTLETTDTPADRTLSFTAKLQDDGTLSGYLSGPMGDMRWTASRSKDAR